jgi:hypothetical protein
MKEAYKRFGNDLGVVVAGGKGGTSRHTPSEIEETSDRLAISRGNQLVAASKMSAKVDSAALQDGYELYHHCFFFTPGGEWCVVQQGMNAANRYARRYHWLGEGVDDFVCEPHNAIQDLSDGAQAGTPGKAQPGDQLTLNMVAAEAGANRAASAELVRWNPEKLMFELRKMAGDAGPTLFAPAHHEVLPENVNLDRLERIVRTAHERNPQDFATLLGTEGVGAATVRSLSLIAELIYDAPASHRDPAHQLPPTAVARVEPLPPVLAHLSKRSWADYSYAHGGKDGTPHPVDRNTYDRSIAVLTEAVRKSRIGDPDKTDALKRLAIHERGVKR